MLCCNAIMEKFPDLAGSPEHLKLVMSPPEQRALATALAHAIATSGEMPPEPVISRLAEQLAPKGPEPNQRVTLSNFCPDAAAPIGSALTDYALAAQSVKNMVGAGAKHPAYQPYLELGPVAESLAGEMAAISLDGHDPMSQGE
jgi:hypothetical protein